MVVFLVAGKAGRRRALENIVDMAGSAGYVGVRAAQLESGLVVVKRSSAPALGRMAG